MNFALQIHDINFILTLETTPEQTSACKAIFEITFWVYKLAIPSTTPNISIDIEIQSSLNSQIKSKYTPNTDHKY